MSGYAGISRRHRKGDTRGSIAVMVILWLAWQFIDVLIGAGVIIALVWVVVAPIYRKLRSKLI